MAKLHEIIAIFTGVKKTCEQLRTEAIVSFNKKEEHYSGRIRTYTPATDKDPNKPDESKILVTTVYDKLNHVFTSELENIDIMTKVETTNTVAKADLILPNGEKLLNDVPATVLLNLEKAFIRYRDLINQAPTTEPNVIWVEDGQRKYAYTTATTSTDSTRVEDKFYQVVPPTDKHPAQTASHKVTIKEGTWSTTLLSGKLLPSEKAKLLARCTVLINALKQARERANSVEVLTSLAPAKMLIEYVLNHPLEETF